MVSFNFLDKLLPPEEKKFYMLFEESSLVCKETAQLLNKVVIDGFCDENRINAKKLKHRSIDISKETLTQLNATFVTPIDREDIQLVTSLLTRITKKIVKATLNYDVYRLDKSHEYLNKQSETLLKATDELIYIVTSLRKHSNIKDITQSYNRMKEIETNGDEILHLAMDALFSGKYDALTVIKLRDLHKDIESALDTCFSVSDTVLNIVLKHG